MADIGDGGWGLAPNRRATQKWGSVVETVNAVVMAAVHWLTGVDKWPVA